MSLVDLEITTLKEDVLIIVQKPPTVTIEALTVPDVTVLAAGNVGPPGPPGKWVAMTQAEYNALSPKDPTTLYVIVL